MFTLFDFINQWKIQKTARERSPYGDNFFEERLAELKERVDNKRYVHTLGVIETAKKLAQIYKLDENKARLAAVLHDWDKGYSEQEMRERIYELGANKMVSKEIIEYMPKVCHGLTAALDLGVNYPSIPADVLKAVMNHTTGNERMSRLDMIIYIADALEPGRNYPEYKRLYDQIGKLCIEDLFCEVFKESVIAVIKKGVYMHPETAKIWNANIDMISKRHLNR